MIMLTKISLILYFPWLFLEICKSAFAVIRIIWQRKISVEPVFEWIDAEGLEEFGEIVYSNSITLTPGTVTLDINNNMLLVHALDKSSITDLQRGGMIKKIKNNLK
ncbi:MAG TPA: monovalent cation/H+ antiporter subunit E [Rickettsia endosymbiont of Pyrocoelia pectoralis]|nr:monovalent cation/H+ antiporter subunit E [Rickettsia endosymbiont of Pyrocoelia pectoralis]